MTHSKRGLRFDLDSLAGLDEIALAKSLAKNPMFLDRLVSELTDIRNATTERAKTRFSLVRSLWPNLETGRMKNVHVSWLARDMVSHRDIEVLYDFRKREYTVKDKHQGLAPDESKEALAMIYAIIPKGELKMISIMQDRYDTMIAGQDIKRAAGRRR